MVGSPQPQLLSSHVGHQGAGHGKIEAANTSLACVISSSRHGDREDAVAGIAHRFRKPRVFPAKQQHIASLERERSQRGTTATAAADQPLFRMKVSLKFGKILGDGELDMIVGASGGAIHYFTKAAGGAILGGL